MVTQIHFGDNHQSTVVDKKQLILLEETNLINSGISYQQMTVGGLIGLINNQQCEIDYLKEIAVDCGYVECGKCGQVIHKDEAVWIKNERVHICKYCMEQEK